MILPKNHVPFRFQMEFEKSDFLFLLYQFVDKFRVDELMECERFLYLIPECDILFRINESSLICDLIVFRRDSLQIRFHLTAHKAIVCFHFFLLRFYTIIDRNAGTILSRCYNFS